MTDELEEGARELIERIDDLGGAVAAIEQGFMQREIEEAAYRHEREVESGEQTIVGVNAYTEGAAEPVPIHRLDPEIEQRQVKRTRDVRAQRDADAAEAALRDVRRVAAGADNLLPSMRIALAAYCTVGEISDVLREEFGTYD